MYEDREGKRRVVGREGDGGEGMYDGVGEGEVEAVAGYAAALVEAVSLFV